MHMNLNILAAVISLSKTMIRAGGEARRHSRTRRADAEEAGAGYGAYRRGGGSSNGTNNSGRRWTLRVRLRTPL